MFVSAIFHQHNITVTWCREFADNLAIFAVYRNFFHFLTVISCRPSEVWVLLRSFVMHASWPES